MTNTLFSSDPITVVKLDLIEKLKKIAEQSSQKCARFCLHNDTFSGVQQMLVVLHRDARFNPHRHPEHKTESIHLIEGEVGFTVFDDSGSIIEKIRLSPHRQFLIRLAGNTWHLPVVLGEWAVFHEIYQGPYVKNVDVELHDKYRDSIELENLYNLLNLEYETFDDE
ncbi:WbuC family cupin fold metalloprotein [Pseudoalteromonas xiamenensis]|uniref:WbuC family cupin fold metalloprotein n=1 Tax=Pseudoalteromonas xiamenensis TaxID=882626 RepID=A0A975DG42_9GAMM|nr:WbuC family cupin fold metalloprotein [Pseudoalteromonas xiamenensis]QTH71040.1 WbuC family cupin fold metalloprotein [Pseudoalteromonas xiamenensis]